MIELGGMLQAQERALKRTPPSSVRRRRDAREADIAYRRGYLEGRSHAEGKALEVKKRRSELKRDARKALEKITPARGEPTAKKIAATVEAVPETSEMQLARLRENWEGDSREGALPMA